MSLYTLADLHLACAVNKPMDIFGGRWQDYMEKIEKRWTAVVSPEDVVVIGGDLSWGIDFQEAKADFEYLDRLPGRKIILKGNHDLWWNTMSKMRKFVLENGFHGMDFLHNNCYLYEDIGLCGTRGWFYEEDAAGTHTGKMLAREALRLEASFKAAGERPILCFLHYPPLYQGYRCPELLELIDRYRAERCYYGHLHGPTHRRAFEGRRGETDYALVSADYLGFVPKKICD